MRLSLYGPLETSINELVDELLKGAGESDSPTDTPKRLVEIKIYHHSVVETDLSIHIFWDSEPGSQKKSPSRAKVFLCLKEPGAGELFRMD